MGQQFGTAMGVRCATDMKQRSISDYDLFAAWFDVANWCAYDLARGGHEGLVLRPLGKHPNAASLVARGAFSSQSYMHRKIGASLIGWTPEANPQILTQFFHAEADRDSALNSKSIERLDTQSVVESIVFAAARHARDEALRTSALELLIEVVRRTIEGQYWNTASYAITTLVRYSAPDSEQLLQEFEKFAIGSQPDHPSRPSLSQERGFAEGLMARNPTTMGVIERILDQQDQVPELDPQSQSSIDQLCEVAKQFETE